MVEADATGPSLGDGMVFGVHVGPERPITMKNISLVAALVFGVGLTAGAYAQSGGDDLKKAGTETKDATKDAAKGAGKAVKTGAKKTKNGVKKGTNAAASGVEKGASKVEDKTK